MTLTTNPLFSGSDKEATRIEWSRLAAKRGRELKFSWLSLARILTRNPELKLEFTGGTPCTDGATIWLRIPIELGDPTPHERSKCGHRDPETHIQLCHACKVMENVETTMYHEVFHITCDSFAQMSEQDKINLLKDAFRLEGRGKPEGTRIKKLEAKIRHANPFTFVHASNLISPWFGILLNVAEDGRVNKTGMDIRPGVRKMFEAQTFSIFTEGNRRADGTISKWSEAPVNMQALIMLYCKIFRLDYTGWFDERVISDLDDFQIDNLCQRFATCRSVEQVYQLCIPTLERLRELGYCKSPEDPEDEPKPEKDESEDKSDDESDQGEPEKGESDDTSDDEPQSGSDDEEQGEGAGSGGSSAPDDDEDESGQDGGSQDTSDEENGPETPGKDDESESEESTGDEPGDDDSAGDSDAEDESSSAEEGTDQSDEDDHDNGTGSEDDDDDDESESESTSGDDQSGETGDEESDGDSVPSDDDSGSEHSEDEADSNEEDNRGEGPEEYSDLEYGEPDECDEGFKKFGRHEPDGEVATNDTEADRKEVERALVQGEYFDTPSLNVWGVNIHTDVTEGPAWVGDGYYSRRVRCHPIEIPETILTPALTRLRIVFADNQRGSMESNLKRGRVNGRVLGRRVATSDPRLFERKILPGKKDWFVLVGMDVSGSTANPGILPLIKSSGYAMAEMLNRLGVANAIYAHTGASSDGPNGGMDLDMYVIKAPEQPWDNEAKHRLCELKPSHGNIDGHTLEFYRKVVERQRATNKLVLYYTDGAMPAANFDEELEILQREIKNLRRMGCGIVGVGIRNDDPNKHGLDTVRLDQIEDVPKVVGELERRLAQ